MQNVGLPVGSLGVRLLCCQPIRDPCKESARVELGFGKNVTTAMLLSAAFDVFAVQAVSREALCSTACRAPEDEACCIIAARIRDVVTYVWTCPVEVGLGSLSAFPTPQDFAVFESETLKRLLVCLKMQTTEFKW